jgi:lipoprotein-releasing system permease protein
MGASTKVIRFVFLYEGLSLAIVGAVIGIAAGLLVCLGQRYFGWVGLPNGLVITAYPVVFQVADFILVFCTAMGIGLLAAWYPARKAALQTVYLREE